jgi:glycosyltransferase involved in cell wall biosynthesis
MKIGINALWLWPGVIGGGETYLRELLAGLTRNDTANEYVLFTNRDNDASFAGLGPNFRRVRFEGSPRWDLLSLARVRFIGEQFYLPARAARERLDVLHAPLDIVPFGARCPVVLTVHDLNFANVHEVPDWAGRWIARKLVIASLRRASELIAVSEYTRKQICSQIGIKPDRVSVTYNAPRPRAEANGEAWPGTCQRLAISEPYILALSSLNPNKNIATLLRAFARVEPRGCWKLVVAGHPPRGGEPLAALARSLGVERDVRFTGYLEESDMQAVLKHARLLAFPSLYEGFGLPVVDAMAAGIPVACSRATAVPEVAADAAVYFDPLSIEQMADALQRLLTDDSLRARMIAAGLANAKRFSWDKTAELTLRIYERAAGSL